MTQIKQFSITIFGINLTSLFCSVDQSILDLIKTLIFNCGTVKDITGNIDILIFITIFLPIF
jgi:hypothetical protein